MMYIYKTDVVILSGSISEQLPVCALKYCCDILIVINVFITNNNICSKNVLKLNL